MGLCYEWAISENSLSFTYFRSSPVCSHRTFFFYRVFLRVFKWLRSERCGRQRSDRHQTTRRAIRSAGKNNGQHSHCGNSAGKATEKKEKTHTHTHTHTHTDTHNQKKRNEEHGQQIGEQVGAGRRQRLAAFERAQQRNGKRRQPRRALVLPPLAQTQGMPTQHDKTVTNGDIFSLLKM